LIIACAVKGDATYIITYDPHFDLLDGSYHGIQILRPLNFLYLIRGDAPPKP
jgi:predicted nucleic acid-binding protein